MSNNELIMNAYIPSAGEYDQYFKKFRAFMNANLSEKARKNGAFESEKYKKGCYFLRTAFVCSSCEVVLATVVARVVGLILSILMPACVSLFN